MSEFPKYRSGTVRVTKSLSVEVVGRDSDTAAQVQLNRVDAQKVAHALLEYCGARAKSAERSNENDCGHEIVYGVDRLADEYKLSRSVTLTNLAPRNRR